MASLVPETRRSISSDESEGMAVGERYSIEAEQGQRLLSSVPEIKETDKDEPEYKVEWHLRTVWVVLGTILTTILVFFAMIGFATHSIVVDAKSDFTSDFTSEAALKADFRRPTSDYVLDPAWNFDAKPKVREFKWTILDRVANPDGIYRPMITINGQFPGPLIECNEGDTLVIDVDNQSVNATSMHFHGIFQNGTNWMDGTSGVTQCPIAPGGKFRYEFTIKGQSGSHYYHGHHAVQASDGLFGPLVVHARNEKKTQQVPYATDRVIMIQDYYHDLSSGVLKTSLEPGYEGAPIPDGALINGQNVRDCSISSPRLCDNATAQLPELDLTTGQSHRLRFINVGALAWFEVSLDEHELAITEVDGTDIVPISKKQMQIAPAQRYSVVVTADRTTSDSFWLRARMMTHCFSDPKLPGPGLDTVKAIVSYQSGKAKKSRKSFISQPTSQGWNTGFAVQCRDMDNTNFSPLLAIEAPATSDHSYFIRNNLEIGNWRLQRGFFNTSSFRPNIKSPSLHRTVDGLRSDNSSFTSAVDGVNDVAFHMKNELVIQHSGIKVVDLIIQNFDEGNHPMHLHGHKYWVLGQGHGYWPGYETAALNISNPIRRDTASVEGFGWLLLRFVTDNPGMWAFHCHMAWHSEAGLAMQFMSQPEVMAGWEVPEANLRLCDAEGLEKGAPPKDETWYGFGP